MSPNTLNFPREHEASALAVVEAALCREHTCCTISFLLLVQDETLHACEAPLSPRLMKLARGLSRARISFMPTAVHVVSELTSTRALELRMVWRGGLTAGDSHGTRAS